MLENEIDDDVDVINTLTTFYELEDIYVKFDEGPKD